MHLAVDLRRITTVKVNGQVRYTRDRASIGQARGTIQQRDTASEAQLPVEPGGQDRTTIDFYRHLAGTFALHVRLGFEHQSWRVGVGADDTEARLGVLGDPPGDDGSAVDKHMPSW